MTLTIPERLLILERTDTDAVATPRRKVRIGDVIALSGPLGVGKTALARALIKALGYDGDVPSPSFAIVQPYEALDPPLWHVDLYRIEQTEEILELGLESALDEAAMVVEWPEPSELLLANALRMCSIRSGWRAALDALSRMGSAMASPMIPPR